MPHLDPCLGISLNFADPDVQHATAIVTVVWKRLTTKTASELLDEVGAFCGQRFHGCLHDLGKTVEPAVMRIPFLTSADVSGMVANTSRDKPHPSRGWANLANVTGPFARRPRYIQAEGNSISCTLAPARTFQTMK